MQRPPTLGGPWRRLTTFVERMILLVFWTRLVAQQQTSHATNGGTRDLSALDAAWQQRRYIASHHPKPGMVAPRRSTTSGEDALRRDGIPGHDPRASASPPRPPTRIARRSVRLGADEAVMSRRHGPQPTRPREAPSSAWRRRTASRSLTPLDDAAERPRAGNAIRRGGSNWCPPAREALGAMAGTLRQRFTMNLCTTAAEHAGATRGILLCKNLRCWFAMATTHEQELGNLIPLMSF
ncbi:hypothetical protein D1007_36205 [Hordeum vulgare]|nr:hypothetical protein D1007_36205 [Hordeum vulgare]